MQKTTWTYASQENSISNMDPYMWCICGVLRHFKSKCLDTSQIRIRITDAIFLCMLPYTLAWCGFHGGYYIQLYIVNNQLNICDGNKIFLYLYSFCTAIESPLYSRTGSLGIPVVLYWIAKFPKCKPPKCTVILRYVCYLICTL